MPINVVVLDAGSAYIRSLVAAMSDDTEIQLVAHGSELDQLFDLSSDEQVDLVLIDVDAIHPPAHAKRNALGYIQGMFPTAHLFVVTTRTDAEAIVGAASRATAVVAEGADPADVLSAFRNASTGAVIVQRDFVSRSLAGIGSFPPRACVTRAIGEPSPLTSRQTEVLELLGRGLHVSEIARQLGISLHTARGHVKSILAKLGSHSQLEAVVKATSRGWLGRD